MSRPKRKAVTTLSKTSIEKSSPKEKMSLGEAMSGWYTKHPEKLEDLLEAVHNRAEKGDAKYAEIILKATTPTTKQGVNRANPAILVAVAPEIAKAYSLNAGQKPITINPKEESK